VKPFPIKPAVARAVENVPNSDLAAAGNAAGVVSSLGKPGSGAGIVPLSGTQLKKNGKPEVLFLGSEYCPYCAATRWPLVIALSKFGTWHGLEETSSSYLDVYSDTNTLDFAKATYKSPYLVFDPTEQYSNHCYPKAVEKDPQGNTPPDVCYNDEYYPLQRPSKATFTLVTKYDTAKYFTSSGADGIPFIDFGGKYIESGSLYSPQILHGVSWGQIARALKYPTVPNGIGQAVLATANRYIAMLCEITHNKPPVCSQPFVKSAEQALKPA
jgi:hypothetical protein